MTIFNAFTMVLSGFVTASIGFLYGILKEHPKVSNSIYNYVRVKLHRVEYKTDNNALALIIGKCTITNGTPNPVFYDEVAVEFNDMHIKATNPHSKSIGELLEKHKKWILYNQELAVTTSATHDVAIDRADLLEVLSQHPQLKMRIAIVTYRYGTIRSDWSSIDY